MKYKLLFLFSFIFFLPSFVHVSAQSFDKCYNFERNLSLNSRGVDVVALQNFLIDQGYKIPALENGVAKGFFGPATELVVKRFQKDRRLPDTGFVGPLTRQVLNSSCDGDRGENQNASSTIDSASSTVSNTSAAPISITPDCYQFERTLTLGSQGLDVSTLQSWLIKNGYDIPAISTGLTNRGYFGPSTASALSKYQKDIGLEVSGSLGATSREQLNSCSLKRIAPTIQPIVRPASDQQPAPENSEPTSLSSIPSQTNSVQIVYLNPNSTTPGSTVVVYGTGFNENTYIALDGNYTSLITPRIVSDQSMSFIVPSNVNGTTNFLNHTVQAYKKGDKVNISSSLVLSISRGSDVSSGTATISPSPQNLSTPSPTNTATPSYTPSPSASVSPSPSPTSANVTAVSPTPISSSFFAPIDQPTAVLTANGSHALVIVPGNTVTYKWSSTNADTFYSSFTSNNPSICGQGDWIARTANGYSSQVIQSGSINCLYTVNFTAKNSRLNVSKTDTMTVRVEPSPTPSGSPTSIKAKYENLNANIWSAIREYFDKKP